jgi:hypothetical protein
MITIAIFILAGIAYSLYDTISEWGNSFMEHVVFAMFRALFGLGLGLAVAIALPMDTYFKMDVRKLEALQDNGSVSGRFFLGSGQFDGEMKYVYYYQEDGYFKMNQASYKHAMVRYTDKTPLVGSSMIMPTESWVNMFAIDLNIGKTTYIFELPTGTIKNNFNLDAK